jgi:hypothetical protein
MACRSWSTTEVALPLLLNEGPEFRYEEEGNVGSDSPPGFSLKKDSVDILGNKRVNCPGTM